MHIGGVVKIGLHVSRMVWLSKGYGWPVLIRYTQIHRITTNETERKTLL